MTIAMLDKKGNNSQLAKHLKLDGGFYIILILNTWGDFEFPHPIPGPQCFVLGC